MNYDDWKADIHNQYGSAPEDEERADLRHEADCENAVCQSCRTDLLPDEMLRSDGLCDDCHEEENVSDDRIALEVEEKERMRATTSKLPWITFIGADDIHTVDVLPEQCFDIALQLARMGALSIHVLDRNSKVEWVWYSWTQPEVSLVVRKRAA